MDTTGFWGEEEGRETVEPLLAVEANVGFSPGAALAVLLGITRGGCCLLEGSARCILIAEGDEFSLLRLSSLLPELAHLMFSDRCWRC